MNISVKMNPCFKDPLRCAGQQQAGNRAEDKQPGVWPGR